MVMVVMMMMMMMMMMRRRRRIYEKVSIHPVDIPAQLYSTSVTALE
jgi:hypothetical protein